MTTNINFEGWMKLKDIRYISVSHIDGNIELLLPIEIISMLEAIFRKCIHIDVKHEESEILSEFNYLAINHTNPIINYYIIEGRVHNLVRMICLSNIEPTKSFDVIRRVYMYLEEYKNFIMQQI